MVSVNAIRIHGNVHRKLENILKLQQSTDNLNHLRWQNNVLVVYKVQKNRYNRRNARQL